MPWPHYLSLIAVFVANASFAGAIRWHVSDGGNGHWYEVVSVPDGITWDDASTSAIHMGGHLATITAPEENDFVFALIDAPLFWHPYIIPTVFAGPWLGGIQSSDASDPASDWLWVSDEPFAFANWHPGEPNDFEGRVEDRIHFMAASGTHEERSGFWNDEMAESIVPVAFVVEFVPEPSVCRLVSIGGTMCLLAVTTTHRRRRVRGV